MQTVSCLMLNRQENEVGDTAVGSIVNSTAFSRCCMPSIQMRETTEGRAFAIALEQCFQAEHWEPR